VLVRPVKANAVVSEHVFPTGWGLICGLGVSSEIAWDATGRLGYAFNDVVSLVADTRGLGVDYRNDGFVFDVIQHGPIFGAVFRF